MNNLGNKYIVHHKSGAYQVMVWNGGKHNYIGLYPTIEEARQHRDNYIKQNNIVPKYQKNYIDAKELYIEMVVSKAHGKLTRRALEMLMLMVKHVNRKFRYDNVDDKQDVMAYSYEIIIKNWMHFDEDKYDNAFAYFTELIKRAHAHQWKHIKKEVGHISIDSLMESRGTII